MKKYKDFPKEGIVYRDVLSMFEDSSDRTAIKSKFLELCKKRPTVVIGIESRGFIMAAFVAEYFGSRLLFARKKGKVPGDKVSAMYKKEYGEDTLELTKTSLNNEQVLIVDDLLATGGTLLAVVDLAMQLGAAKENIACYCTVAISECKGVELLKNQGIDIYVDKID